MSDSRAEMRLWNDLFFFTSKTSNARFWRHSRRVAEAVTVEVALDEAAAMGTTVRVAVV